MPAILVLDLRESLALDCFGDNERRLLVLLRRLDVGCLNLIEVMAVNFNGMPAERAGACSVGVAIPAEHRLAALAEAVHNEDAYEVAQLIVSCKLQRLIDRTFGHLTIAQHYPDTIGQFVQILASESNRSEEHTSELQSRFDLV